MMQATLRDALRFEGIGLHTGVQNAVEVRPAEVDSGIAFVLGTQRVPATAPYVTDTSRATVVGEGASSISTTEHLLSALFAMGVTNAEIHVDGPEIPVLDGSAAGFVDAIEGCGLVEQMRPRAVMQIDEPLFVRDRDRLIAVFPSPEFRVRFVADFPAPIGTQYFYGEVGPEMYKREIAGARTFGYLHEIEALRAKGLALGGTLENALVFTPDGPMRPLRWPDEAVRHKVLDLIGDLALLGAWPQFEVVAIKSGHQLHSQLTQALFARARVPSA